MADEAAAAGAGVAVEEYGGLPRQCQSGNAVGSSIPTKALVRLYEGSIKALIWGKYESLSLALSVARSVALSLSLALSWTWSLIGV